jgi:hypothetical protein
MIRITGMSGYYKQDRNPKIKICKAQFLQHVRKSAGKNYRNQRKFQQASQPISIRCPVDIAIYESLTTHYYTGKTDAISTLKQYK